MNTGRYGGVNLDLLQKPALCQHIVGVPAPPPNGCHHSPVSTCNRFNEMQYTHTQFVMFYHFHPVSQV